MRPLRVAGAIAAGLMTGYLGLCVIVADEATRADRRPVDRAPTRIAEQYEDVALVTSDGLTLRGWYFPPRPVTRPAGSSAPAAILLHGKDANRIDGASERLARTLHGAGYALLLFDMRAHGASDGERFSLGQHERLDVAAAVDHLVARGVPERHVVLFGRSMGAGIALQALAVRPAIGPVIADSPYSDGRAIVEEAGPADIGLHGIFIPGVVIAARLLYGLDVDRVDPERVVRANPDHPILLIHCERDRTISVEHSRRLRAATRGARSDLWIAPDCEHAGAQDRHPAQYDTRVLDFLAAAAR